MKDFYDKIYCRICNKYMTRITPSHVKLHDITHAEYIKLYPNVPVISKKLSKKIGDNMPKNWKPKTTFVKGYTPWNKGLNKNTDIRIKMGGEKISKITKGVKKKPMSDATKKKISMIQKGKKLSTAHKRKLRLARIKEFQLKHRMNFAPNYNLKACKFFDQLNLILCLNGMHGENGGEYHIKELGYWVDFYEPDLNLVIEWDEITKDHFKAGKLIDKDIQRQKEIEDYLKCDFLRIKGGEITEEFNDQLEQIIAFKES